MRMAWNTRQTVNKSKAKNKSYAKHWVAKLAPVILYHSYSETSHTYQGTSSNAARTRMPQPLIEDNDNKAHMFRSQHVFCTVIMWTLYRELWTMPMMN